MKRFLLFLALCSAASGQIARVAANCTGTSSCTTTGNAIGDLEIAYAGVNLSATAPTTATGWTSVGTGTINGTSTADSAVRMACKVATGTSEASNTFTNATSLIIMVYRGQRAGTTATCASAILGTPVFTASTVNTTTTTETFGAVTNGDASSWDVGFGYCSACTAGISTAPTNMANQNSITGPPGMGGHDTNGTRSSFGSANVTLTTVGRIITGVVEIKAAQLAAPSFSPGAGTYTSTQTVTPTIPGSSTGCYTTDGSTPAATTPGTCSTGSTYTSGTLSVSSTETLKMLATQSTWSNSTETDALYTITRTNLLTLLGVGGGGAGGGGGGGGVTPTVVQKTAANTTGSNTTISTGSITTTTGNAVAVACLNAETTTVTLSATDGTNTYIGVGSGVTALASEGSLRWFVATNITGVTHALTCNQSGGGNASGVFFSVFVYEIHGANATSPVDVPTTGQTGGATGTSATPSFTLPATTVANDLLLFASGCGNTCSPDAAADVGNSQSDGAGDESETYSKSATGTYTGSFTQTSGLFLVTGVAVSQ